METVQRHADPYIPPWTDRWSMTWRIGFGVLAIIPFLLLMALFASVLLNFAGVPTETTIMPVLFYTHVGAQFITLLIFGHLLFANPHLSDRGRLVWAAMFLLMAPFSIPVFWLIHIWNRSPVMPDEQLPTRATERVDVYDFDYTGDHSTRVVRREDGSVIHHVDATA